MHILQTSMDLKFDAYTCMYDQDSQYGSITVTHDTWLVIVAICIVFFSLQGLNPGKAIAEIKKMLVAA